MRIRVLAGCTAIAIASSMVGCEQKAPPTTVPMATDTVNQYVYTVPGMT
jgi:hypothetical protein